jgi:predicted NBD/HSP70 family sugar kinase
MKSSHSAILQTIYQTRSITRKDLSVQVKLSPNHVNNLVSAMIDQGVLTEETAAEGNLGRPAALLSLNADFGYVVGMDIGLVETRAILTNLNGQVCASTARPTQIVPDREIILQNVIDQIYEVCSAGNVPLAALAGVGISVLGIVDAEQGLVLGWTNRPDWERAWVDFNIKKALQDRLNLTPVILENTVRAMGVNAHRFGPAKGIDDFLYVFLGSNTGSSIFINGQPYFGSRGISGEIGHVTIDDDGPWCRCGNRGCLEAVASTPAVLGRAEERLRESQVISILREPYENKQLTLKKVIAAASTRDKLAFQIMDEVGAHVGKVLAFSLNLLGPEMVVLAGPLAQDSEVFLNAVQRQVDLHALQQVSRSTKIVCDIYDPFSGTRGAALMALERIFSEEEYILNLLQRLEIQSRNK